ncbi:hypothetical protein [Microbacterium gorillae]|uniref:hypothetical protein n=1 Tax=Microbacterium gorillae TaxID=1231063 RepID=UPI003D97580F
MTELVEMTADEAEFIAECIATALPTDEGAAKYFEIADRIRAAEAADQSIGGGES